MKKRKLKQIFSISNLFMFLAFIVLASVFVLRYVNQNKTLVNVNTFENQTIIQNENKVSGNFHLPVAIHLDENNQEDPVVGVINIPKINEKLAIYDNETQDNLDKGCVVFARFDDYERKIRNKKELSLDPDINKHAIILGHSGTSYSNLNMFLKLEEVEHGDLIYVNNGKEMLTYQVFNDITVLAENVKEMYDIEKSYPNEKIISLVTCVPVHVNTHRLIVHGKLINREPISKEVIEKSNGNVKQSNNPVQKVFHNLDYTNKIGIVFLIGISLYFLIGIFKILFFDNKENKA